MSIDTRHSNTAVAGTRWTYVDRVWVLHIVEEANRVIEANALSMYLSHPNLLVLYEKVRDLSQVA